MSSTPHTGSSKVCMWDAFGDFACTKAPSAASKYGKDAVPGFSPSGAFGSEGASVSFDSRSASHYVQHPQHQQQREGFCGQCSALAN